MGISVLEKWKWIGKTLYISIISRGTKAKCIQIRAKILVFIIWHIPKVQSFITSLEVGPYLTSINIVYTWKKMSNTA